MKYRNNKLMKRKFRMSNKSLEGQSQDLESGEVQNLMSNLNSYEMMQDRIPRGIEIEENRIYFYCPVGDKEALELNRILRRLDIEMEYLSNRLECGTVPIHLHIHSPGGAVFAGLSIVDTIKRCKTPIHIHVDGSAASAATLIACAGKKGKRTIGKSGYMLVHQPHIEWFGKLDDFRDEVNNQEELYDKIVEIYLENTNFKRDELKDLLEHELWLNAEKCIEYGLVDKVQ